MCSGNCRRKTARENCNKRLTNLLLKSKVSKDIPKNRDTILLQRKPYTESVETEDGLVAGGLWLGVLRRCDIYKRNEGK